MCYPYQFNVTQLFYQHIVYDFVQDLNTHNEFYYIPLSLLALAW